MSAIVHVKLFFNFRSPYCYLASKKMWPILDDFNSRLLWRPVGGWDLRSTPDRAKTKMPLSRQDLGRFARRLGIPVVPPPVSTDPTLAGAGSFLAEKKGLLRPYIIEMMRAEWSYGRDIGQEDVLLDVAASIGLDRNEFVEAIHSTFNHEQLRKNAEEAVELGVIGVPTFVIDDQVFWGQDRIDFVIDELRERRASKI
ncbi:2-hydroxychromene-2-carboxylate isomerase [Sphingobium phenoxybenzoativorans]|uniref:2-hydroxychromene-2-carboxylate isomerase n=1 Tax=Sphingobium phenoxybenzoativorans TaxID=1592790 RepID=UPI000871C90E|nr:DsbA family protein [Sphingobium phenoxybenzoativorans]